MLAPTIQESPGIWETWQVWDLHADLAVHLKDPIASWEDMRPNQFFYDMTHHQSWMPVAVETTWVRHSALSDGCGTGGASRAVRAQPAADSWWNSAGYKINPVPPDFRRGIRPSSLSAQKCRCTRVAFLVSEYECEVYFTHKRESMLLWERSSCWIFIVSTVTWTEVMLLWDKSSRINSGAAANSSSRPASRSYFLTAKLYLKYRKIVKLVCLMT